MYDPGGHRHVTPHPVASQGEGRGTWPRRRETGYLPPGKLVSSCWNGASPARVLAPEAMASHLPIGHFAPRPAEQRSFETQAQ